ncbi:MAG: hypothetical protein FJ125_11825 [Deltaproteobacteria bacterium]|nr:hypothetical protein [Deltaproteobacteria bacterium]
MLAAVRHPIARQHYLAKAAQNLDLDEKRLYMYSARPAQAEPAAATNAARPGKREVEVDQVARHLLELLVDHPELAAQAARSGVLDSVPQQPLKDVLKVLFRLAEEEGAPNATRVLESLEDGQLRQAAREVLIRQEGMRCSAEEAQQVLDDILRNQRRRRKTVSGGERIDLNRLSNEDEVKRLLEARVREVRRQQGLPDPASPTDGCGDDPV